MILDYLSRVRSLLPLLVVLMATPALGETLDAQRLRLQALTAQEDVLEARIGTDRNVLSHLLSALALFRRDPPPPLIVRADDARDAVRGMILVKALAAELQTRLATLEAEASQLSQVRRRTAVASGGLFEAESQIEDRQGRLDAMTRDAALLAPPTARRAVTAEDSEPVPTQLVAPTAGRLQTRFGGRLENGLAAQGLAYRTAPGAAVVSPARGVIAYAGPVNGWGEVVILRAGGGCHMVLSGLGKVTVSGGQVVTAGLPIGAMPTLGASPPELYFEVRLARGPVDPAKMVTSGPATDVNAVSRTLRREGVN